MKSLKGIAALLLILNTGCATILAGKSQTITVNTNPPGARCELIREGRIIGVVENTPGAVSIDKTKHDIDFSCKKDGFTDSKGFADSGTEGSVYANIILGGGIGWAIDSAAGTDNKYPDVVTISLAANDSNTVSNVNPVLKTSVTVGKKGETNEVKRKLISLDELKKEGLLTEKEYATKKAEVLKDL